MNQRIQELWLQAGGHYNGGNQHTWPEYTIADLEKFAQLLVGECADIANEQFSAASELTDRDCWTAAEIKKHFGVEP